MSTFSKGDQVRCVETWTTYVIDSGDKFTVDDVRATVSGVQQVYVQGEWVPARYFEKVEPEDTDDELADWERALLADAEPEPLKEGASGSLAGASEAFEQMANAMRDFAAGFEKAGKIFWREMQRVRDGGAS